MIATKFLPKLGCMILSCIVSGSVYAALTDISSVPLNTYTATSSVDVKPNLMFILDDSGSMGWDYLPDWANDNSPPDYYFKNSAFNGVAYNPALRYSPPVTYDASGAVNTTKYLSMTGASTATGGDSSATSITPNWEKVPDDGFGVQFTTSGVTSTSPLQNNAHSYTSIAGEYCTAPNFRTCSTTASATYSLPAILRWCNSSALTTCKATNDGTYNKVRMAIPRTATITVSGTVSTSVTGITVNGLQIMSGPAAASTTSSTVASNIAAQINLCSNNIPTTGSICTVVGYTATASGSVVTIFAPATISDMPLVTPSPSTGGMTFTTSAFAAGSVPGENIRTTITSSVTSYAKASKRTDCAGTTCTYAEEMTNYANWWAYYHTRMQMMKSAASQAFSTLDTAADITNNVSRFRVGYMTINNNQGSAFINLDEFKTGQKNSWYTKILNAKPGNSTPLRETLADAGRIYAGKKNGSTYNGVTVIDPLQYSCQPNYTILSTDGFWNGNAGYKLDGSTAVGNQDAALPRPMADGASVTLQTRTSTLQAQTVTNQQQIQTSSLQQQTSQLQKGTSTLEIRTATAFSTAPLEQRDSTNYGGAWGAWYYASTTGCVVDSSGKNQNQCQGSVQRSNSTDSGANYGAWYDVSSVGCTVDNSGTSRNKCQAGTTVTAWSAWANAASCTSSSTTECQYTTPVWVGVSSCTAVPPSAASPYTVANATQCQTVVTSPYMNATTCTVSGTPDGSGNTIQCQYSPSTWTAWSNTDSCTPVAKSSSPNYTVATAAQCQTITSTGTWASAASCTISATQSCQYTAWSLWTNVGACTAAPQSTAPNYMVATARECQNVGSSGGTSNTLADVAAYYYGTDLRSSTATGADATGTCTGPVIAPATTANDLCANNVKTFGRDVAATQHMTTFTLGLGAQGEMVFSKAKGYDYWADTSGDFYDVWKGTTANPTAGICAWQSSGTCNWPVPASDSLNNIDDLWHAGINGRGAYFSASDPSSLSEGLSSTLKTIVNTPKPGTAAAAASSNPNISSSDNYVFSSSYKSVEWYGELIRQQLSASAGTLTAPQWSSMTLLDCATTPWQASSSYVIGQVYNHGVNCYKVATNYTSEATFDLSGKDTANTARVVNVTVSGTGISAVTTTTDVAPLASRTIYTKGGSGLIPFTWSSLSAAQQAYFSGAILTYVSPATGLSQFCTGSGCLTAVQQTNTTAATGGAAGENLVNFLRGERTNEGTLYRSRVHVLGDIVTSEGRYVKQPLYNYTDTNFMAYKESTAIKNRQGMVYVAANDGMLHAFNADSGQEAWAYIPELVLPNIYKLADKDYANKHQYFVDGTPEVGEFCPSAPGSTCSSTQWKTILVGGLNYGGKGYYALDITDPASPVLLWEISSAMANFSNLGYSYSNPRITKLKDGTWVVIFASGYNNADGKGHLYTVNAQTGVLISDINNNVAAGSATNPSGLSRISAHAPNADVNNTTVAVYGGDLFGNLWRFDINGDIAPSGFEAQLLVTLQDSGGTAQPITTKPTLTTISGVVSGVTVAYPVVYIGTGRYLGVSDVSPPSTQAQTFYAIKDNLGYMTPGTTALYGNPHTAASSFVMQTLTGNTGTADTTCPASAPTAICAPTQVVRLLTNNSVDWGSKNGWYFDLWPAVQAKTKPELSISDSSLGLGTLVFTTISLQGSTGGACSSSGGSVSSYSCAVDYLTGGSMAGSYNVACVSLGSGVATRPVMIELSDGTIIELIRSSGGLEDTAADVAGGTTTGGSDMGDTKIVTPPPPLNSAGGTRRVSWRKLQM